jgi:integrase
MRQLSAQRWELRVYAGTDPLTGKKRYVSRTVTGSKREAESALARLVSSTEDQGAAPSDVTVKQLLAAWLEACGDDLSPTTLREYRRLVETRIEPGLGGIVLRKVQPAQVDRLYRDLRTKVGLAPSSVRKVHAILHRSFDQAMKWGWIQSNVIDRTSPPRLTRPDHQPPTPEQVVELIETAWSQEPAFGMYLHLAAVTGARRGELCGITWSDIDFNAGSLLIHRSVIDVAGVHVKDTKTHAARRIALDDVTLGLLRAHRGVAEEIAAEFDVTLGDGAFVFSTDPAGRVPRRPDSMTNRFVTLAKNVGVAARLHDLRHFSATRLLAAGVPVRTVSGRLGHADAATTLNVYAHFVASSDRHAANVVGGLVNGTRAVAPRTRNA